MEQLWEKLKNETNIFTYDATNVDGLFKFLATIDWSERWLQGLIVFHVFTTLTVFFTRRFYNFQILYFLMLLSLCYFSEKINELGAQYWNYFAMEQYFDSNGLFISVVWSGPIILNLCFLVVLWLYECYTLIIKVVKLKKAKVAKENKKTQ